MSVDLRTAPGRSTRPAQRDIKYSAAQPAKPAWPASALDAADSNFGRDKTVAVFEIVDISGWDRAGDEPMGGKRKEWRSDPDGNL